MDDGFGTRPDELRAAAGRFDEAAAVVATAVATLHAALGDHLGTDEQGRAFAARYRPAADEGTTALDREAGGLRSLGEALRSTARDYDTGDAAVASGFRASPG